MTIKPVFQVLAIALFLLIAGTATNAAGAELDRPTDIPGVTDARLLIESGKYDKALDALRPLTKTYPKRADILFLAWSGGDRKIRATRHH